MKKKLFIIMYGSVQKLRFNFKNSFTNKMLCYHLLKDIGYILKKKKEKIQPTKSCSRNRSGYQ